MQTFLKTTTFLAGFAVAAFVALSPVEARETIIGLSPSQSAADLQSQAERIVEHLVETIELGESALIFDALNNELIGTFAVPENEAYSNPRAKLQVNGQALSAIRSFFENAEVTNSHPGALDLPSFLRTIAAHYPSSEPRSIIVLGSPVYDDPLALSYSMDGGRVPNDGAIGAPGHVSPFSTGDLSGTLEGDQVFFGVVPSADAWAVSRDHAYHVERIWTLMVQGHGGSMPYFGEDLETLFRLSASGVEASLHPQPLALTDKLEMIQFFPDQGRVEEAPDEDPRPATADSAEIDWRAVEGLRIRATWDNCSACDLDLYVRPSRDADALYYAQSTTADGQLYKQLREGVTNGFEVVVLNGAVDLTNMVVAVNLYARQPDDEAPVSIAGQLEFSAGEISQTVPFSLSAETGSRGAAWEEMISGPASSDPHWVVFHGADLIERL